MNIETKEKKLVQQHTVTVGEFKISNDLPLTVIAGPCQLETSDHAMFMAENLKKITDRLGINFIFKTSFDKANRSSIQKNRGVGLDAAVKVFEKIRKEIGCLILTDIHAEYQCAPAAEYVDILQIPAYLCRQTDLLAAAAKTGNVVNIKKGQFLAPWDVANIVAKFQHFGSDNILITERGACFGYNNLVCDMRSLKIIADTGVPVVFDATHSVQRPGGLGTSSGGDREFVEILARAATAVGVAAVFLEVHQDPDNAPCDGPNMVRLDRFEKLMQTLMSFDQLAKSLS